MAKDKSFWNNLSTMGRVLVAAGSLSLAGVLGAIFGIAFDNDTTFHPADNYGPEDTWYQLVFNDRVNFEGSSEICVIGGMPQRQCNSVRSYKDVSDGRSVKLYDKSNPDKYLPEGMLVVLYWGRKCNGNKPYGVIRVPANVKEIRVPRLNKESANYKVYNIGVGDRMLNGHVYGINWFIP